MGNVRLPDSVTLVTTGVILRTSKEISLTGQDKKEALIPPILDRLSIIPQEPTMVRIWLHCPVNSINIEAITRVKKTTLATGYLHLFEVIIRSSACHSKQFLQLTCPDGEW